MTSTTFKHIPTHLTIIRQYLKLYQFHQMVTPATYVNVGNTGAECIVIHCYVYLHSLELSPLGVKLKSGVLKLLANPQMQKIYENACQEGSREVYRTRIMLVGHFAAGKTSVKRSLLNERFVSEYLTTKGVETEETVNVFMTDTVKKRKGPLKWKKVWCKLWQMFINNDNN